MTEEHTSASLTIFIIKSVNETEWLYNKSLARNYENYRSTSPNHPDKDKDVRYDFKSVEAAWKRVQLDLESAKFVVKMLQRRMV